jgi:peptide/nickel transport system permease protein
MSRRLRWGLAALVLMTAACVLAPLVLPRLPASDPLHSALLPPGTRVTVLTLEDGRAVVGPELSRDADAVTVGAGGRQRRVETAQVSATGEFLFVLGSDRFGRDVLRQLLEGGRISLIIAALGALLALTVGVAVGIAAGAAGGVIDSVLMRTVDALMAFPVLFLMILAAALFRPGPALLIVLLGSTSWMSLARLVRGQVLSLRSRPFVLAARASGSTTRRIATLHYIPNLIGPVSQDTALRMGDLVIAEASLSFLGLGVPVSIVTWGAMVADGHRAMLDGWWLAFFPGLAIAWLVIALAVIGDGLQQYGEAST